MCHECVNLLDLVQQHLPGNFFIKQHRVYHDLHDTHAHTHPRARTHTIARTEQRKTDRQADTEREGVNARERARGEEVVKG